ncbi:MAG: hypothetical protein K2X27_15385 [Candidatus Obscuribacterales bacterium]|nr:hypothetical protein [Candidatus Obscuribacterales bacterium]
MTKEPQITIVLLNYKRPQNIPIILESIKNQSVPARVFLFNNGGINVNAEDIDCYEESPVNLGCMARWKMAQKASTPYLMSLDDDICFKRNDALEKIIQSLEKQDNPNRAIGFFGLRFKKLPIYTMGKNMEVGINQGNEDLHVDIVKGRVMAFRKDLLDGLNFPEEREDDIYLSALFAKKKRRFHRLPLALADSFTELEDFGVGNWQEPIHYSSRNRAVAIYFSANAAMACACIFLAAVYSRLRKIKRKLQLPQFDSNR